MQRKSGRSQSGSRVRSPHLARRGAAAVATLRTRMLARTGVPSVVFSTVVVANGDGSYVVRPGRAEVKEWMGTSEFGKRVNLSRRRVIQLCEEGKLKYRRKTPGCKLSNILVKASEVGRMLAVEE